MTLLDRVILLGPDAFLAAASLDITSTLIPALSSSLQLQVLVHLKCRAASRHIVYV